MFYLFGGAVYNEQGGMDDLIGVYASLNEAMDQITGDDYWGQIATIENGRLKVIKYYQYTGEWQDRKMVKGWEAPPDDLSERLLEVLNG